MNDNDLDMAAIVFEQQADQYAYTVRALMDREELDADTRTLVSAYCAAAANLEGVTERAQKLLADRDALAARVATLEAALRDLLEASARSEPNCAAWTAARAALEETP